MSAQVLKVKSHLVQPCINLKTICGPIEGLWWVEFYAVVSATSSMTISIIVAWAWQVHTQVINTTTQLNSTQFIFSCAAIFLSWTAILSCCEFQFVDRLPFVDRLTAFPQTPSMWLVV